MSGILHRKNINCLTSGELHDLREAFAAMYQLPASNPNSFARQASFHGGPPTAYCRHGTPGFFTWHRAEMKAFEDALRAVGCHIALPFWDWSSGPTTGIPHACRHPTYVNRAGNTVPNPLFSGPRANGGMTTRSANIDTTSFADLATSVQAAMSEPSFTSFQQLINSPHGSVHGRVGGDMALIATASYDPIFYFHHANVDRIWAEWQLDHPGPLPTAEANLELPPFTRPFTTEWQRGSDVESTETLGYRYRTWCIILPPIRIWEVIRFPLELPFEPRRARLFARARRMQEQAVEIRVFVNEPEATARTRTVGNAAFAGAFGFIGMGTPPAVEPERCPECARLGHTREHPHHHGGEAAASEPKHGHGHGHHHHHGGEGFVEERFDVELQLADDALRALAGEKEATLRLVAVDSDGNDLPAEKVLLDEVELAVAP